MWKNISGNIRSINWLKQSLRLNHHEIEKLRRKELHSKIQIKPILPEDYHNAISFLKEHFYRREVVCKSINYTELCNEKVKMIEDCMKEGYSLKAVLKSENLEKHLGGKDSSKIAFGNNLNSKELVGVYLNGCITPDDYKKMLGTADKAVDEKLSKFLRLMGVLLRDADVFQRFGVQQALYTYMGACSYSKMGIGTLLMEETIRLAKMNNFRILCNDCSTAFSTRMVERIPGFEPLRRLRYIDYKDGNGEQVFKPENPELHQYITTFAKVLQSPDIVSQNG